MQTEDYALFTEIYDCFNARDIDGVLAALSDDVAWANGMEGGHVEGIEAVRDYWTRQWAIVSPHVEPVGFTTRPGGTIAVEVIQTVFDLDGSPLGGATREGQQLKDKTVLHVFRVENGRIVRFDIEETA